ncbi:hypothetical protein DVR12_19975 [Chitinophaga silvatica]|uniref:Uncharacterized protein n=1 Tax=Chitinophaga silvatica TaxID=2282649 RepID=A0A3E1Y5K0_9BACT|nr:hypothetical protein DVR12_19975 [Chitinophaga silvatica]
MFKSLIVGSDSGVKIFEGSNAKNLLCQLNKPPYLDLQVKLIFTANWKDTDRRIKPAQVRKSGNDESNKKMRE